MSAHPYWYLINPATNVASGTYSLWHGELFGIQTISGAQSNFLAWVDEGALRFHIARVSDDGSSAPLTASMHFYRDEHVSAANAMGGLAVAGAISVDGKPDRRRIVNEYRGPSDLARDAAIFGMGQTAGGSVLVIQAGDCDGCISAQWFYDDLSTDGVSFTLLTGFVPGPNTWFETAEFLDGTMAVRR